MAQVPLLAVLVAGGMPLLYDLARRLRARELGSDILAGISILTSLLLGEYLAGALVVLMMSGGQALEGYAARKASAVLQALAKRVPTRAHRSDLEDVPLDSVAEGDTLVVFPHEICPVDGVVLEGHGIMDESYLTGEPFQMSKTPGSEVLSGAINGETALTIRALRKAVDSRYARIMAVMKDSEQQRPRLRRLGDRLGAVFAPLALAAAVAAWLLSGHAIRFLAVLVIATPCPLLIGIPVAIIGSISLCAQRGIIVKNPVVLEQIAECRTMIFDKTGTLTYGEPELTETQYAPGADPQAALSLAASLERYSKHPLSAPIQAAARRAGLPQQSVDGISERPGEGLLGTVAGHSVQITGRHRVPLATADLPQPGGLECVVLVDGAHAATFSFRDRPRADSRSFIDHLGPNHMLDRVILVSGDRESEVCYLADRVGITEVYAELSPEDKLDVVRRENQKARTVFLGDGINDAPALLLATVGLAFGQHSDITSEAAGAVILETSLKKVDEFFHISRRMRTIALQSAVGGMLSSAVGMMLAAGGHLSPVSGAVAQEVIDLMAVLNALRAAWPPAALSDF